MGPQAGGVIEEIVPQGRQRQTAGTISAIVGFFVRPFLATGVFGQRKYSPNEIWYVQAKPGRSLWGWLRKRILSLGMLLGVGFLLLVSLGVNTAVNLLFAGTSGYLWQTVNVVASLLVYAAQNFF